MKCEDKIDNCAEYPKSVCANYLAWTKINCARYCGHCSGMCVPLQYLIYVFIVSNIAFTVKMVEILM